MRPLRRLGQVQMTTAATVGNLTTVLLAIVDGIHGHPLMSWAWFLRHFAGWHG